MVEKRKAYYACTILCGPLLSEDSNDSLYKLNANEKSNSSSDSSNLSADRSDTTSVSPDMISDKNDLVVVSDNLSEPEKFPRNQMNSNDVYDTDLQDGVIDKGNTDFLNKIRFKRSPSIWCGDEDDYWQDNSAIEMDLQSDQEIDIPQLEDESNLSKIIKNFYEYLTSDSGNKDKKTAQQCCFRVQKMIKVVSRKGILNFHSLVIRAQMRDFFFKDYCEK